MAHIARYRVVARGQEPKSTAGVAFSHTVNPSRCNRTAPRFFNRTDPLGKRTSRNHNLQRTGEWCGSGVSRPAGIQAFPHEAPSPAGFRSSLRSAAGAATGSSAHAPPAPVAIARRPLSPAGSLPAKSGSAPTGHNGLRSAPPPCPRQLLPCVRRGGSVRCPAARRPARSPRSLVLRPGQRTSSALSSTSRPHGSISSHGVSNGTGQSGRPGRTAKRTLCGAGQRGCALSEPEHPRPFALSCVERGLTWYTSFLSKRNRLETVSRPLLFDSHEDHQTGKQASCQSGRLSHRPNSRCRKSFTTNYFER